MNPSFDNDLKEVQEKTQAINRKRMNDQQRSYEKLSSLKEQALELQMKNYIMTVGEERGRGSVTRRKHVTQWKKS